MIISQNLQRARLARSAVGINQGLRANFKMRGRFRMDIGRGPGLDDGGMPRTVLPQQQSARLARVRRARGGHQIGNNFA